MANRPTSGIAVAGLSTRPPRRTASATVASRSGVLMYASQWGGAPWSLASAGKVISPPIGPRSVIHMMYEVFLSHASVFQPTTWV
jgi:hypothetical protein